MNPCDYLHPYADKASHFPHNTKVFNLCLIRKMGLDIWAKDKAKSVRAIRTALAEIGQYAGADRAYVFDYDFQTHTTVNKYEWDASEMETKLLTLFSQILVNIRLRRQSETALKESELRHRTILQTAMIGRL